MPMKINEYSSTYLNSMKQIYSVLTDGDTRDEYTVKFMKMDTIGKFKRKKYDSLRRENTHKYSTELVELYYTNEYFLPDSAMIWYLLRSSFI